MGDKVCEKVGDGVLLSLCFCLPFRRFTAGDGSSGISEGSDPVLSSHKSSAPTVPNFKDLPSLPNENSLSSSRSASEVKDDGELEIEPPPELKSGKKPLWSKYIVGYFIGDAPHIGKVHATLNRLWSSPEENSMIDAQFISSKTVLFKIMNDQMRNRVLRRNFGHIADVPLVVREWNPATVGLKPDLTSIPLWVDLSKVPDSLFTEEGLKFLGDQIGSMQRLHRKTERCVCLDIARLLVVVNLEKPLPAKLKLKDTELVIHVSYSWLPSRCLNCRDWGHGEKDCERMKRGAVVEKNVTLLSKAKESGPTYFSTVVEKSKEVVEVARNTGEDEAVIEPETVVVDTTVDNV